MRKCLAILLALTIFSFFSTPVKAVEGSVLGIHILHPSEAAKAKELLNVDAAHDEWHYVTVPLSLNDLKSEDEWKEFFKYSKENKLIPVVRLMTKFENGAWTIPTKRDIVDLITFLSKQNWPTDDRYIIVFNEVNHTKEWGGQIDPSGYADTLRFTSNWAKSEGKNYKVLPAAMDLAAPNSEVTREAFNYLQQMLDHDSSIFSYIDAWNSHSYPNPAFSSSPERTEKNSVRGFIHELSFIKDKTGKDYRTFITETGWIENAATRRFLQSYYTYAAQHIWSDPRVIAVTPFVLQGDPGPFSGFTFVNRSGQPTLQYIAYQNVIKKMSEKN
jgi:hypothetical protein